MARKLITRLAEVRETRGLTQKELGELVGVSPVSVSAIENRHVRPWPKFRRDASRVLGIDERELFEDTL